MKTKTKHHKIAASHFNKTTLCSLSKKGLILTQATWVSGIDGNFANGMTAFIFSNGQMKSYLEVIALVTPSNEG